MIPILKTALNEVKGKRFWKDLLLIVFGMWLTAASIYYFLVPAGLAVGNVSGLSIILSMLAAKVGITLKVSTIVLILNAILLVLALILVGSEFGVKTFIAALLLGPMMDLWALICPYESLIQPGTTSVMGNLWFDVVAYVLLISVSQAILFRINASTGGLDIVAMICKKYFHLEMGTAVTVCGIVICLMAFSVNSFQMVVIGFIATWLNGVAIDYFTAGLNRRKRVCIVTPEYERVKTYIIENIGRGCSLYEQVGGYTGKKNIEVQSLLTQTEFGSLMEFIKVNNINAFISASNVNEVYGFWLKHRKLKK